MDGGEHIVEQMKTAGFVDVQCYQKTMYYGDWNQDPQLGHIWREKKQVYAATIEPIILTTFKMELPNLRLREKFARDVVHDFLTHDYHMYRIMYVFFRRAV